MNFKNIFELKALEKKQNVILTKIVELNGGKSAQYIKSNYESIAKEGYSGNYIIGRCINEIVRAAVQLDWKVMRYNKDNKPEEIPNHPAVQIMEKPNPTTTEAELVKRAIIYYYLAGDAPFVKITAGNRVKELYVHNPRKISVELTGNVEEPYQGIRYNGQIQKDIESKNFTLWKNFDPLCAFDGLGRGISPLEPILKNGDLLNLYLEWGNSLLNNGGSLSGIVAIEETLQDPEYERAKAELKNEHQGAGNVGKFLLLEGGAKYYSTGSNPRDMQWVEGKNSTAVDIMVGIGVDPLILGFNEHSSYNNKNEAYKALYTNLVIPLMRSLADELGPFLGLLENEYLDIDYSKIPCLQEDIKELTDRLQKADDLTINEKRQARGLDPLPGGDIIVNNNFILKDGKLYKPVSLQDIDIDSEPQDENLLQDDAKSLIY
jgi:HK97 family phage portal protein